MNAQMAGHMIVAVIAFYLPLAMLIGVGASVKYVFTHHSLSSYLGLSAILLIYSIYALRHRQQEKVRLIKLLQAVLLMLVLIVAAALIAAAGVAILVFLFNFDKIHSFGNFLSLSKGHNSNGWGWMLGGVWCSIVAAVVARQVFVEGFGLLKTPAIPNAPQATHRRGASLIGYEEANTKSEALLGESEDWLWWGGVRLPMWIANTHFSVTGATGAGKTILLRILMQTVLRRIGSRKDTRALIYDAKQDMLSVLHGMEDVHAPIVTLNPFDARCAAWDMAKDITAPATAQQIAAILIPEEKNSVSPYFSDAARALLTGVFVALIERCPGEWTFRDVVYVMRSSSRLKQLLSGSKETKDLTELYFSNEKTANDVMSTIATKLQRYQYIAAMWGKAEHKISLREWLDGEFILVLGNDEATRTALDAINQVIFKRLTELILAQDESETRKTWIFLDEVREAGKLDGLSRLLTKGRSKGACVVLGFQDIEGLRDVYGAEVAGEITGQCTNKAILRIGSPETARWASTLFGEREVVEINPSTGSNTSTGASRSPGQPLPGSNSGEGQSSGTTQQIAKRDLVLASELQAIAPTNKENGLTAYFITPAVGTYKVTFPGPFIDENLDAVSKEVPNMKRAADSRQYLEPWSATDLYRLKIFDSSIEERPAEQPATFGEGSLEGIGE